MKNIILTLCVAYNNGKEAYDFVKRLLGQQADFPHYIVVVDNSGENLKYAPLYSLPLSYGNVFVYATGENMGYYGAAAWGLERYLESSALPDWIIVSNTDIVLGDERFFNDIVGLYGQAAPAVIAPAILSMSTGIDQNPFLKKRPTRLSMQSRKWIFRSPAMLWAYQKLSFLVGHLARFIHKGYGASTKPEAIYAPHGAFIIFSREYFERGGTLEHGPVMFNEEITVAEMALRLGLEIIYDPRLRVKHEGGTTTGYSVRIAKLRFEAAKYAADTYFPLRSPRSSQKGQRC